MKKFKEFIKSLEKDPDLKIKKTKEGYVIIDEPLTIRTPKKLKESLEGAEQHNDEHHTSKYKLSAKLHLATAAKASSEDKKYIKDYTGDSVQMDGKTGSYHLNTKLIAGKPLNDKEKETHDTIKRNSVASGHEFHVFSGTTRDFEHLNKHTKDGVFHSPAHISASHDSETAKDFADTKYAGNMQSEEEKKRHLIHIHVKPHDKILHTSQISHYPEEHETIIPSGTNLKYSHSTDHNLKLTRSSKNYRVHHFTIHSQE